MGGPLKLKFANHFIIYKKCPFRGRIVPGGLHSELCAWGVKFLRNRVGLYGPYNMDLHGGPFLALFYPIIMQIFIAQRHFVMEDHGCNLLLELKYIQSTTACFA